jgi:hypothetical protein
LIRDEKEGTLHLRDNIEWIKKDQVKVDCKKKEKEN